MSQLTVEGVAETNASNDPQPAHHFNSLEQQFDAAKLGMWLFLGTEVLFFGALFVLYAVLRNNHPEVFVWGAKFLSPAMGGINTVVLILSSLTAAFSVGFIRTNRRRAAAVCLALTAIGGVAFLGVKYQEYAHKIHEGLVWGPGFYRVPAEDVTAFESAVAAATSTPRAVAAVAVAAAPSAAAASTVLAPSPASAASASPAAATTATVGDAKIGQSLWDATCRACHGAAGEGITGQGKDIRTSAFILERDDAALLKFIKAGRMPFDKLNTTGIQMPPKGGNPLLKDADLMNIIAYVRTCVHPEAGTTAGAAATAPVSQQPSDQAASAPPAAAVATPVAAAPAPVWISKSSIPNAPSGPQELSQQFSLAPGETFVPPPDLATRPILEQDVPVDAHLFFAIYYAMTGLHGIHVLIGIVIFAWLAIAVARGRYSAKSFTAIDLSSLYWHLVDVIWIFLFPLFYLID